MIEFYKMYRFSQGIYTIPLNFDDIYINIIEISRFKPVASLERIIYRDQYASNGSNIFEAGFNNLDSEQMRAVFKAVFREIMGWS